MTAPTDAPTGGPAGGATARRHGQRQRWWWWALMLVVVVAATVVATDTSPTSGSSDERLFAIGSQLKCLQCVGESVAGSQSPLAVQFRDEIREQMSEGRTDDEILNFFADRYGQEVLLNPPSTGVGGLVWVIPVVAVVAAMAGLVLTFRRWRRERSDAHASPDDERRVAAALTARSAGSNGNTSSTVPSGDRS